MIIHEPELTTLIEDSLPEYFGVDAASDFLQSPKSHIINDIDQGRFPAIERDGHWIIKRDDFCEFVQSLTIINRI